ncbi:MAG: SDR family NAD(P)-dependent oxidoreductase [Gammaproteobacteria bacterium]
MPTVVITGAGSGLGRALAQAWATRGWQVVATDRDGGAAATTVRSLAGSAAHLHAALDVTRNADFEALVATLDEQSVDVDVMVNNAGVAGAGLLTSTPLEHWDQVLDINLLGVVRGCRAFASKMTARKTGHIVNIASFAAIANAPAMSTYNVTKAGVVALSETLRTELNDDNIGVTVVCPSFFETNLLEDAAGFGIDIKSVGRKLMSQSPISADDVAVSILNAVEAKSFMCIPHRDARWLYRLKRFAPETFARIMVKKARGMLRKAS